MADHIFCYVRNLVRATRPDEADAPDFIKEYLSWGAGPRAGQYLILGGKARAVLAGRFHVTTEDIRAIAHPVFRHRLLTNFHADTENLSTDNIIGMLLPPVRPPLEQRADTLLG